MSKIHYYCRQAASTTKSTNICPQQETTDLEEQLNDLYCIYTQNICFNINGNIIVEPAFYTFMLHTQILAIVSIYAGVPQMVAYVWEHKCTEFVLVHR